jgi:hypothetical protein
MKLLIQADIPDADAQLFLRHIRLFDFAVPGCAFTISGDTPDKGVAEIKALLTSAGFDNVTVMRKQ